MPLRKHPPREGMEPASLLKYALETYPGSIALCDARTYYIESTRGGDDRDGSITCAMPDEIVKAVKGPADKATFRLIWLAIPSWVEERAGSRLVLPGE